LLFDVNNLYQIELLSGCQARLAGKAELSGHLSLFDIALWLNCSPQPSKSRNFLKMASCLSFIGIKCRLMAMHPKTLQRELHHQGVSFRALRARARLDAAEHYLRDSTIPLTRIAEMPGFSELSALSRAFKTRHGISPAVWRATHARVR
jgi:hypothetical protein